MVHLVREVAGVTSIEIITIGQVLQGEAVITIIAPIDVMVVDTTTAGIRAVMTTIKGSHMATHVGMIRVEARTIGKAEEEKSIRRGTRGVTDHNFKRKKCKEANEYTTD